MSDALGDLCKVLRSVGATMTLYGKPASEAEVRAYATGRVDERLKEIAMKKRQKRRGTLSVSAKMYEKLVAYSNASGESISSLVERLVRDLPPVEGK